MHEINLLDETFVKNQSYHYHLSIQTGLNGLSFSILDLQNLKYVGLRNYFFDNVGNSNEIAAYLSSFYQRDDLLKLNYKSVSHLFIGGGSTIVPSAYFDAEQIQNFYKLNFSATDNGVVLYNSLDSENMFNIFSYPETLYKGINEYFPKCKIFHQSTPFLDIIIKEAVHLLNPRCYLYIYKGIISIAIVDQKKLQFYNTFSINSISDILYFILGVFEQYQLLPKQSDLFISSDIDEHDEIFEDLNTYFKHIRFITPSKQFTYSYLFDELYLTRYANLFNLALCG